MTLFVAGTARQVEVMRSVLFGLSASRPHVLADMDIASVHDDVTFAVINHSVAIGSHSAPLAALSVPSAVDLDHDRLMTVREAADALVVSPRTVTRRVNDGSLVKVGRRITAESVARLKRGTEGKAAA